MNVLFLNLLRFSSFEEQNIYTDLLREFIKDGHNVYAVCPSERRYNEKTNLRNFDGNAILTVRTFNIQKSNLFEKGLGTLLIKSQFKKAIKKHLKGIIFDLILYPTPPITLYGVVNYFKKRDNAITYLMLKDIFPQNAVDIGILKTSGVKGLLYKYFRKQEKKLYASSDRIGCMSPANVEYLLKNNPEISKEKIEVFPNCIDVQGVYLSNEEREQTRTKYNLPLDKTIFVYGGNLGKPQGIPFILDCLKAERNNEKAFFLIVGDGTEFSKVEQYYIESKQENFKLLRRLPTEEFNKLLAACNVGLVFLDYKFTIPNFPSRILSYMQARLPILACTDVVTDIGKVIVDGGFGWWCNSVQPNLFCHQVDFICGLDNLESLGRKAYEFCCENYNVSILKSEVLKWIGKKDEAVESDC